MSSGEISTTGAMQSLRDKAFEASHRDPSPSRPKLVRIGFGVGLLVTGVLGLILPILPGTVLALGGVWILARDLPVFDRIKRRVQARLRPETRGVEKSSAPASSFGQESYTTDLDGSDEATQRAPTNGGADGDRIAGREAV